MSKLKILTVPNPILHRISKDIDFVDKETKRLSEQMLDLMYESKGIGLAAPQVGKLIRLVVIDLNEGYKNSGPFTMINPVILQRSEDIICFEEGCLSVPGRIIERKRNKEIKLCYYDLKGNKITLKADGLLSVCIQHEIDHLDGIVISDN